MNMTSLTRARIRQVIRKHRGSLKAVACAAGVKPPSVHKWLKGHGTSANIEHHATARALELLEASTKGGK